MQPTRCTACPARVRHVGAAAHTCAVTGSGRPALAFSSAYTGAGAGTDTGAGAGAAKSGPCLPASSIAARSLDVSPVRRGLCQRMCECGGAGTWARTEVTSLEVALEAVLLRARPGVHIRMSMSI
jgi:hypothetical protein